MGTMRWVFAGLGVGAVGAVAGFVGGLLGGSPRSRAVGAMPWTPDGPAIPVHALPQGSRWPGDRVPADEDSGRPESGSDAGGVAEPGPRGSGQPTVQEKTGNRSIPVGTSSSGGR
jgi:hypothetical protein